MRALTASLGMVLATLLPACGADGPDVDFARSVLALSLDDCSSAVLGRASAVVVGPTTVVTVAHPFAGTGRVDLVDDAGASWPGELRHLDGLVDLAVIELGRRHPHPLGLGRVRSGDVGRIVGYGERSPGDPPRSEDVEILRRVRVTLDGEGERGAIELAAPIRSGDSGAPVIDTAGRVAGIVFASARTGDRGWAVDDVEVRRAIQLAADAHSGQLLTDRGCP